ncbi:unnamed protein product [Cuscuta campestris]|uniref:Uncharacterized protein n=1 Tax=Cuscuta campestris TaxID=132261 RepID=A0A484MVW0_9ASTE|nr:unnamed protein product [Cuscuta campestris]
MSGITIRNNPLRVSVTVCFLTFFLLCGVFLANHNHRKNTKDPNKTDCAGDAAAAAATAVGPPLAGNLKIRKMAALRQEDYYSYYLHHPPRTSLNYVNKRTVPKGPDPIHNRKSPPGQP